MSEINIKAYAHIDMFETCLPRGYLAKVAGNDKSFIRDMKNENQSQFKSRIMHELDLGIITHYK